MQENSSPSCLAVISLSTGPVLARWLRNQQHEVFSIYEEARGMDDEDIIR